MQHMTNKIEEKKTSKIIPMKRMQVMLWSNLKGSDCKRQRLHMQHGTKEEDVIEEEKT